MMHTAEGKEKLEINVKGTLGATGCASLLRGVTHCLCPVFGAPSSSWVAVETSGVTYEPLLCTALRSSGERVPSSIVPWAMVDCGGKVSKLGEDLGGAVTLRM